MKRSLLIVTVTVAMLLASVQAVFAQTPDSGSLSAARQLYEQGQFVEASAAYQQFVDQGQQSPDLYYNLGNAYYNQGELGRAIANYLRAEKINPRDPDIQANLRVARSQTKDSFGSAGRSLFTRWVETVGSWVTLDETAIATFAIWMVFGLSIFVILLVRIKWLRGVFIYTAVISGILLVVSLITLIGRISEENVNPEAVVVVEVVDAVSGPGSQYTTEVTLHNGTEASIKDKSGNWVKIAIPDGQTGGWVPASSIEEVSPANQRTGLVWTLPFL